MSVFFGRHAARMPLRVGRILAALASLIAVSLPTHAVVVHGAVTDAFGRPIVAARVQLVQGPTVVAFTLTGVDGTYELRSTQAGRFTMLTSAVTFTPGIGENFYGGTTDEVAQNVILEASTVRQVVTVTATGLPTPVEQSSSPVTLISESDLATRIGLVDDLRQSPGVAVVQTGQTGGVTSLFLRGGNSDANKVLIDGIPAEDIGGRFDFGTVSSTAIGAASASGIAVELYRGPDSVLYGSDASAGVVSLTTPRGTATRPVLIYSGDAGNLHTYRNEAVASGAYRQLDYLAAFSRLNTSNALPMDEYHSATSAINLGYTLPASTLARFTLRNAVSASGLPGAHDFYGISAAGKESDQDIYSGLTLENRTGNWHNLIRYGIARKREQATTFYPVGQAVKDTYGTTYYGNVVTIRGANGYTATGQAAIAYSGTYPQADYAVSNRDELFFQSDYTFPKRIVGLFGFRYENERGSFLYPTYSETERLQRTNFEYTAQFSGDLLHRVFYSVGGAVVKNHLYGIAGAPRLGLAYVPVRPGARIFQGTKLRANVATGVQEPSLAVDFSSLYTQLAMSPKTSPNIALYGITPIRELRSRTYDIGIDQNIVRDKLILKVGYFHNQFSHQIEYVGSGTLKKYFGITGTIPGFYGADVTSLAFRAQGLETEVQWQPLSRLFVRGGYTYLAATVEQSFASSALSVLPGGFASTNPAFPNVPVGSSPFIGGRPFRRPPHTGFFAVQYTGNKFTAALKGALASRSDDSTFLDFSDLAGTDSLILPNRNLDFGYAKLDASLTYAATHRVTAFTQLDNLLNQQHIGPIGYPGLPLTIRAGLKVRLGGD